MGVGVALVPFTVLQRAAIPTSSQLGKGKGRQVQAGREASEGLGSHFEPL